MRDTNRHMQTQCSKILLKCARLSVIVPIPQRSSHSVVCIVGSLLMDREATVAVPHTTPPTLVSSPIPRGMYVQHYRPTDSPSSLLNAFSARLHTSWLTHHLACETSKSDSWTHPVPTLEMPAINLGPPTLSLHSPCAKLSLPPAG